MNNSLFAAFDRYPSSKGAATHIEQSISVLFKQCPTGMLCALGDTKLPDFEVCNGGEIHRFSDSIPNFLDRVEGWGEYLKCVALKQRALRVIHFRDPWSGIPLMEFASPEAKWVYEVNGLPSIELPYHFPNLSEGWHSLHNRNQVFDRIWLAEQISFEQLAFLKTISDRVDLIQWQDRSLQIPPKTVDTILTHTGPQREVDHLVEQVRYKDVAAAVAEGIRLPSHYQRVKDPNLYYANAKQIVSAAGFNTVLETQQYRDKHVAIPFLRRFDDQHFRLKNERKAP